MSENIKIISDAAASGSVVFKNDDTIKVRLKLTLSHPLAETDVLKILLKPSRECMCEPIYCGIAETQGVDCSFSKVIEKVNGCDSLDTVEIIRKNVFTEEITPFLKVCFAQQATEQTETDIGDDLERIRQQLDMLQNHSAYKAFLSVSENIKSPVERAADALEALYRMQSRDTKQGASKICMNRIADIAKKFDKADIEFAKDYIWYRITDFNINFGASAFDHILSCTDALNCIYRFGHYLLGIKTEENAICIAIPVEKNAPNPIEHIDDCTVYFSLPSDDFEYCCVCVLLAPDGQYFMPIC